MKLKIKLYEPAGKSRSTSWRDRLKDRSPERYKEMLQKDRAWKKTSYRAQQMDPSREARMQTKTRKEQVREALARHRNNKLVVIGPRKCSYKSTFTTHLHFNFLNVISILINYFLWIIILNNKVNN